MALDNTKIMKKNENYTESKTLRKSVAILGILIASGALAWGIFSWFSDLPKLEIDTSKTSHLFLNQLDRTAYGQIYFCNKGYRPLTLVDIRGDLIVNIKGKEERLPLSIVLDSMKLDAQASRRAIISLFAADLPLPNVSVSQGKINYQMSDSNPMINFRPTSGAPHVDFFPSDNEVFEEPARIMLLRIDEERDWMLIFHTEPLNGKIDLKITSSSGKVYSYQVDTALWKIGQEASEEIFVKDNPFSLGSQ